MEALDDCITLRKAELAALHEHCCADFTRQHINSVLFRLNGNATAVATDGHRLVRCEEPAVGGLTWEFLAPRDAVGKVLRAASAKDTIEVRPGEFRIGDVRIPVESPGDVQFPRFEHLIPPPSDRPCSGVGCDATYLAALGAIGKAFRASRQAARDVPARVRIHPGQGELDPVRFDVGGGDAYPWTVVIMPLRA